MIICYLQREFNGELTCAVTPVAPHSFLLQSLKPFNKATCRPSQSHTGSCGQQQQSVLFLKKLKYCAKAFTTNPLPFRPSLLATLVTYDIMQGLSFNVCNY